MPAFVSLSSHFCSQPCSPLRGLTNLESSNLVRTYTWIRAAQVFGMVSWHGQALPCRSRTQPEGSLLGFYVLLWRFALPRVVGVCCLLDSDLKHLSDSIWLWCSFLFHGEGFLFVWTWFLDERIMHLALKQISLLYLALKILNFLIWHQVKISFPI